MCDSELELWMGRVEEALRILGPTTTGELAQSLQTSAVVVAVTLRTAAELGRVVVVRLGSPDGWLWSLPPQAGNGVAP
jgi:hypothetical protein